MASYSSSNDVGDDQQSYLESLMCNQLLPNMRRFHGGGGGEEASSSRELFVHLNSLMASPFEQQQPSAMQQQIQYIAAMSASFLSLLVGEFTGGNSSSRYNLPLEFHRLCHRVFENGSENNGSAANNNAASGANSNQSGLDSTLQLSMSALSSLVGYVLNNTTASSSPLSPSAGAPIAGSVLQDKSLLELASRIVDVTCDVLSWEFGAGASKWDFANGSSTRSKGIGNHASGGATVLLRPPQRWRESLINPEFLGAVFRTYSAVRTGRESCSDDSDENRARLAHSLRQLLLQLASIAMGPIFADENERGAYAGFFLDGCLNEMESILNEDQQRRQQLQQQQQQDDFIVSDHTSAEVVDLVTILSRLTTNFKVKTLSRLQQPAFPRYLTAIATMGKWLLESSLAECQRLEGDVECMEGVHWRNDALAQILQCSDAMAGDYWLLSGTTAGHQEAAQVSQMLASMLAPLYGPYCICRVRMSCLEEHFIAREGAELDEIREEISAFSLEEELSSAASLGRLNVLASMTTLSGMFQQCMPRLVSLFECVGSPGDMSPDMAALLEEARMLLLCAGHLLTDDCVGETPAIPESVINACQPGRGGPDGDACTGSIVTLVDMLKSVAESQAVKVAAYPEDPRLSPLLAKTLLWFFGRWGPAYLFPSSDEYRENSAGGILGANSTPKTAEPKVSFCTTLCLLYFCHWPQEKEVMDESTSLLLALAKRGSTVRTLMTQSPSFEKMAALHSVCASLRHNASPPEISTAMSTIGGDLSNDVVRGYMRLPYDDRARVLTCLVVACSEMSNEKASVMLNSCMKAVEAPFSNLVQALGNKQANSKDINVQESACLSILLYSGIVLASEMSEPERIPHFITPSLPYLSGLMAFYAEDLTICESLLKLFRDYAERYIAMMSRSQCIELFSASASLLKHYSEHHCHNRVVVPKRSEGAEEEFEEEQKYNDVVCAIQLLIHLGTKDFTSACNAGYTTMSSSNGLETTQITDVIFFGLQQILPLMSQGLLQFPTLCQQYFSLVGFMVETYPEKLCALPSFDLFHSLLESLLFGMSHPDPLVSKSSLVGLASLAREHIRTHALDAHLSKRPDIFESCTARMIQEVIFQPIIWDRLEPAGMALLPLIAALGVPRFVGVVNKISQRVLGADDERRGRLHNAFERLVRPEVLAKVANATEGRDARVVRVQFKRDFDVFVRDVQSFLIVK